AGQILGFCFPGCFSIQGPKHVQGREQGSLTVQCHYSPQWTNYQKWWCRGRHWRTCHILVQTRGSEQEEKQGRVSIVDDQRDHSFTVTMEKLQRDDMDTYWCGIKKSGTDLGTRVRVTVYPGKDFLVCTRRPCAQDGTGCSLGSGCSCLSAATWLLLRTLLSPWCHLGGGGSVETIPGK
uniref:Immunoglobulin domain-containing protein n=1 Tax=Spermophilus dauricus TaxID=99837 RepID=A0A8C9QLB2_SPEDA